jgi:phosphate:Na+ symporter
MNQINEIEDQVDNMRAKLVEDHLERLKHGKCQPQSSGVFINLVNNLERAADHLTYIAESIE